MKAAQRVSLCIMLATVTLCVPPWIMAAEPGASKQSAESQNESGAQPKGSTAKKPNQNDVQSRGLFQKKKKKQKGGSASHSQPSEKTDPPTQ